MSSSSSTWAFGACLCAALLAAGCAAKKKATVTAGELQIVHAGVSVGGAAVGGLVRFAVGETIDTGADGRGRLRLDDGASILLDRGTRLVVTPAGASLESGRVFVQGGTARTEIQSGGASVIVSDAAVAFERTGERKDQVSIHCASGEAVVSAGGKQERLRSGETAALTGAELKVAPEKAFNDWTGGMAKPWSAAGPPRSAIGELLARGDSLEDPGTPLAIRLHDLDARIEGEVATTRVETTYFNGGSAWARGDFRIPLPDRAVVSRFAIRRGGQLIEGAVRAASEQSSASNTRLEWAGHGWVRASLPGIAEGESLGVLIEYVEWLSPASSRMAYRFPMVGDGPPPLLGEFHARVDVGSTRPLLTIGTGAGAEGSIVELRKADFRPQANFTVELGDAGKEKTRAYVVPAVPGEHSQDPYVLVRADLPPEAAPAGVALAIVLDTSWSIAPGLLDAERAVVEALVEGLGPADRVAVFASGQTPRPVGPNGAGPVDEPRRKAIRDGLLTLRAAGATDLGAALERAAGALPEDATAAMIVYVGDGWPTVGDTDVRAIRKRLERSARGVPRIAAIAVGPSANRYGLAALAQGSAPVLGITGRDDAAQAAVTLLSDALQPALEGVELDLGATVDRVYPRGAIAAAAGTTVTFVGRVRGKAPTAATLRYHRAGKLVEEPRKLAAAPAPDAGDVRRRWATARVEELSLEGVGLETAVDTAVRASLLTPWTAWGIGADGAAVAVAPLAERVLDFQGAADVPFTTRLAPRAAPRGTLLEPRPPPARDAGDDLRQAIATAARRTIDQAMSGVRKCRDVRAALRPEIGGSLNVRVSIDGGGRSSRVTVRSTEPARDDALLDRCVSALVESLAFFDSGLPGLIDVEHTVELPPARDPGRTRCSPASKLPLLVRRGIWRARLLRSTEAQELLQARQSCELRTGAELRAFVDLLLERIAGGPARIVFARRLDDAGESEAASLVRLATIRDAASPEELREVRAELLGAEPIPGAAFDKSYREATTHESRLAVVRRFLRLSPHDPLLHRRLFALLEAMSRPDELKNEIQAVRQDPFSDAALLAEGASALLRIGAPGEGLEAFGEIIERAPEDPYARAFVGDHLRDEGLFDDAAAAYDALFAFMPSEPAVTTRIGLAHAGAGRLDVALRILERVTQSEGRGDDPMLGELAAVTTAVLIEEGRAGAGVAAARLARRALEVPLPDAAGVLLVRAPVLDEPVETLVGPGADAPNPENDLAKVGRPADWSAPSMGLHATRLERGTKGLRLRLSRPLAYEPSRPAKVRVDLLLLGEDRRVTRAEHKELEVLPDGKGVVIGWNGEVFQ